MCAHEGGITRDHLEAKHLGKLFDEWCKKKQETPEESQDSIVYVHHLKENHEKTQGYMIYDIYIYIYVYIYVFIYI